MSKQARVVFQRFGCSRLCLLMFFAGALFGAATAQAQTTNSFTGATAAQWNLAGSWSLSHVPTSSEFVESVSGTEVRIGLGTAAVATNLTIGGASGTSVVGLRQDSGANSLTVGGNITLAPGAGNGILYLGVGTLNTTSTLSIAGGSGSILDGGGAGYSALALYGSMGKLGLASATFDRFNPGNSSGWLTIGSGQTYTARTWFAIGSASADASQAITVDGGTLDALLLRVGENSASGANSASLVFNSGTIKATDINRDNNQATTFNWNGGTITHQSGGDLTVQGLSGNALTVSLAGTGTRTFLADSGRTITVAASAVLADKSGENGTLTKAGAGTLVLAGTNTYSGVTTVQIGTLEMRTSQALSTNTAVTVAASGATLYLNFKGTNVIRSLTLGTELLKADTVYGSNTLSCVTGGGFLKTREGASSKGTLIRVF